MLRLAERLPSGASEDDVRRSVCELIEADAGPEQADKVAGLLNSIVQLKKERELGLRRAQQAGAPAIDRLLEALRQEVPPILQEPRR